MAPGLDTRLLTALLLSLLRSAPGQDLPPSTNGVNGYSLHPPYFNLAEGTRISASATCGEEKDTGRAIPDLYCKLVGGPASGDPSQTIQGQYCDICSSAISDKAHPITNAIDGTERWWQSPPLSRSLEFNEVNVTLDLGQLFHVAYVLIKFANSPRPDLWVLERSTDFGVTYQPWHYFASSKRDCIERFGLQTVERITKDDDAFCTTEYSRIVPLENGEIVVSLVNGRPGAANFSYSPLLRNFTKATNIRLRFMRTNTLLGHLMGKALRDPTVTRRYYYSIKDISIGGRCVCNGHAEACDARDPSNPYRLHCECQHNTCGGSCDHCCPGFNQFAWKPATIDNANECEPCHCNSHAQDCYYDPEVESRRASMNRHGQYAGGGVCVDCQHHTSGVNCERCISGYYKSPDHPVESPYTCYRCVCESEFMDGTCEDLTGRCYCKPNYTGENCDACAEGYTDFPQCYPVPSTSDDDKGAQIRPAGEIINCDCSAAGTVGNACRKDPRMGICVCKPNFQGLHCESCSHGHYGPYCQACECSGPGVFDGSCDSENGQCACRSGFQGVTCNRCTPGFFNYPLCQLCGCSVVGTLPEMCDPAGRCFCKPEYAGPQCDQCVSGYHSYPFCQACSCDPRGSVENTCSSTGHCQCHSNYAGLTCNQCARGFYGYPSCSACQCSMEGSVHSICDSETGACSCLPKVTGQRCDTCIPGAYGFPRCEVGSCNPAGSTNLELSPSPTQGSCQCRVFVEGPACDRCKPLYWNLTPENTEGCTSCLCDSQGTTSGVAECHQGSGQCFCKPNVCSRSCSVCKDGFFKLQKANYFGCQGCQCDTGGSIGLACDERTGACQCRHNVHGHKCTQPKRDHYIPDLHHLKFEVEEGTTLDGRAVRFGYNPLEFENFSWRGYAQMSPFQNKVRVRVTVKGAELYLFRVILRYINSGGATVYGRITAYQPRSPGSEQTKEIVFAPSTEPTFVTVPQNSYRVPFVLNPNTWSVIIEAEGILLDYLVLLPSAYYEAPILQLKVTEACMHTARPEQTNQNCLLYQFVPLDGFPASLASDGVCRLDNSLPRPCHAEQVTPKWPPVVACSGNDVDVQLQLPVTRPGRYVLLVEYGNEAGLQTSGLAVNTPQLGPQEAEFIFYPCSYSFLCRGVALDSRSQVAILELTTEASVRFSANQAQFLLYKVFLIPYEQFTMEFVEPKVHCISSHGSTTTSSSTACVPSRFQMPSQFMLLKEAQTGMLPTNVPLSQGFSPAVSPTGPGQSPPRPPTAVDSSDLVLLHSTQNVVVYRYRIQTLGRHSFILHYYQPHHQMFSVEVLVNGGRLWQGLSNATFCPHGYGCRSLVISENQIILDVTDNELSITIRIPHGKTLWLSYVLVVPEDSYSSSYLVEDPLDKSYDFISSCGTNGFRINPVTSSKFCRDSAISLSLFHNNGAQACSCHEVGSTSPSCEPFGGQCTCKSNVIGRDCSRCATGYWGFPNCRPCSCETRLCDEVTGQCICPPRTVQPECTVCEPQTFACHPLIGCEECNCSRSGVAELTDPGCDLESGQCTCKPNIMGRQCERCSPGFYGYPNCRRCDCNREGSRPSICDPVTGQCHCKENVDGTRCDQCQLGTFYLDPANPKGCTRCFCFGATDRCHSASKYRVEFMDMNGWVLLGGDHQELELSFKLDEALIEADLSDVPDVYQELYWQAPRSYHGDRVSSYGGYLRYQLYSKAIRGDAVDIPVTPRPDVVLKGNQMSIAFREQSYPRPGVNHEGRIQLVESNFQHTETNNPVSREELMMVLANLEQLQIRALNSQPSSLVSLRKVVLEIATETQDDGSIRATDVELCMCPANYRGDSCQECAPGFYRDTKGLFLGKCIPCNCNGRSDQCLPGSGVCVNCQYNTEGDHCERCKGGFLGNTTVEKPLQCIGCPCPLSVASNNFAIGCVQKGSVTQCLCHPGYAGAQCERCAPGYYGNPMVIGSSCQPCNCSGNTDGNALFSDCDSRTGVCVGCMFNTAGPHCELCAPGYYGDAVQAKTCSKCDCSPCGTSACDPRSGQCFCKPGVSGVRCDQCQGGYFGFDGCTGCQKCNCDVASMGPTCHSQSGQCSCKPGVSGPRCQQCAPGYWGFGANGCTKCLCKGGSCDPRTGECRCTEGLKGKQCDTCIQQHAIPVSHGPDLVKCEPCDSCVLVLLQDLHRMGDLYPLIRDQLGNLSASSIAWARLGGLNSSIENSTGLLLQYKDLINAAREETNELKNQTGILTQDIDAMQQRALLANQTANAIRDNTDATHKNADTLLKKILSLHKHILDLSDQMSRVGELDGTNITSSEEFRQKMAEVERMMKEMKELDFSNRRDEAETELREAKKLLNRVRDEMFNKVDVNQDLVNDIRDRLSKYSSELMDLRDALNEAVNQTRQTDDLNSLNQNTLEESQQKNKDLLEQYTQVQNAVRMAEDALIQVSDLLQMIERVKEEYEKLAARLDGARVPLMEKVKRFSPASSKIPIVEEAEEHARLLNELAKNLSSVIRDTNQDGFIQRAINASNAYASIIDAVKKAERASNDARRAANDALMSVMSEDLDKKAKDLKKSSRALEDAAKKEHGLLNGDVKQRLQETGGRLRDAKKKKDQLQKDLKITLDMLNINTGDVANSLQSAKTSAADANAKATAVDKTVSDMKKNLDKWKEKYGNMTNDDLNKAVKEADSSVSNLASTIPLLLQKLNNLDKRKHQNGSISDSIQRIRQLISQARNAASKVKVPMKFNGNSGVLMRAPNNLEDLAAYTSLKFYIQNPDFKTKKRRQSEDASGNFVLYLGNRDASGDYMGVVMKEGKVQWIYRLGDEDPTLLMIDEEISEQFATISIERILQYGHMSVIVEKKQNLHETKGDSTAKGKQGLLNLNPSQVVFYVGGYPSSFVPPATLNYPMYRGCIEMDTLNEEVISLYNFEEAFDVDTVRDKPCSRSKSTSDPWLTDGSYFDGTGYAEIKLGNPLGSRKRFEMEVRVVSYNGIIFFLEFEGQFLCLAVQGGKPALYYDFGEGIQMAKPSVDLATATISSATNKLIEIFLHTTADKRKIFVRRERVTIFTLEHEAIKLYSATNCYLAGVPMEKLPDSLLAIFPTGGSIRGCMRGLKALDKHIDLKRVFTIGVSYSCTSDLLISRSVSFNGYGFLTMSLKNIPALQESYYTGFGFRTNQNSGLMYHHATEEGSCQVSMKNGRVAVKVLKTELTSRSPYADGVGHYVAIYSNEADLQLYVDDQLQGTRRVLDPSKRSKRQDEPGLVNLGGLPEAGAVENLSGCISNVFVKRKTDAQMVEDLQENIDRNNITMKCQSEMQEKPPQEIRALMRKGKRRLKTQPVLKDRRHSVDRFCHHSQNPKMLKGAFRFGGTPTSHLEFDDIPGSFSERSHFSLEVQLNSSTGLLFYVANHQESNHMALFVSQGRFVFVVEINGSKHRLRSKDKYQDGKWHTVFFSRDKNKIHLVIDGLRSQSSVVPSGYNFVVTSPFYVGGVQEGKARTRVPEASLRSIDGCIKNLKLDGQLLDSPNRIFAVTPCFEGPLESGLFFAPDGGFLALGDVDAIGEDFELVLEIRPQSSSGLIFHVGKKGRYLTLYTDSQKVTVHADNGGGDFQVSVTPRQSLCDGQWHTIRVVKGKHVIQLIVDTEGNHTAWPSSVPSASAKEALYVGGVPDTVEVSVWPESSHHRPSYVGCARHLVINRNHMDMSRTGSITGSVGANGCPAL
ncbi:laminin subunit alpha-5 isoform X2 [Ambystoma mexicanum]|uniref:laminin subunit alpha-5 isoform X2 n=1 Tax=Ambystoma mexicanum TaxID=8296 RepID=UPI0037E93F8F